jgi:hypothetical protein
MMRRDHFRIFARLNQYDPRHYNMLVNQERVEIPGLDGTGAATVPGEETGPAPALLAFRGVRWRIEFRSARVPGEEEAVDLEIRFHCLDGQVSAASVAVDLEFGDWSAGNYVLLPSSAYNGNRFLSRRIPYSPKLHFTQDIGPEVPIIISDVPRLEIGDGPSRIQETGANLAVPAAGFHAAGSRRGVLVLAARDKLDGGCGMDVMESRDRASATISITSPLVRELHSYRICDMRSPSMDQPADFKAGDEVCVALRVYAFAAPSLQDLFDEFARVRKAMVAAPEGLRKDSLPPRAMPFSACFEVQEEKFNRENFVPEHGYFSVGPRTNFLQDWQIGWTGGMISTYPLLFAGCGRTRDNVVRNFDWLFPDGISPSGFFWDCGANGDQWIGGDIRKPHTGNWHLIRKSGDAVYYILKQFALFGRLEMPVKPAWRGGVRLVCDALVSLWEMNGQFGQFVDAQNGKIHVGGSSSGAIIPAALVLAADYFQQPGYLDIAVRSGEKYFREFTEKGITCGGPGDALQNPDSESGYALIESYMYLYEATGERAWLERAAAAARQFSTWVVGYDFDFPASSTFGAAGIRSTGAVYANTQNKHAAPGICTFSGLALFKLFRATGDRFHLDLLRDIARHLPQYLSHPLQPLGTASPGHMCERVNLGDWEGPERIGETLNMTTWAETSLMLTTVEIPGIYVAPERGLAVAFDNIGMGILRASPGEIVVQLSNPAAAPARVRVFEENRATQASALPENYLFGCRTIEIAPGASQTVKFGGAVGAGQSAEPDGAMAAS